MDWWPNELYELSTNNQIDQEQQPLVNFCCEPHRTRDQTRLDKSKPIHPMDRQSEVEINSIRALIIIILIRIMRY